MIVDLFAGPGGWSEGLRSIGLSDVGLEWDESACRTRSAAGHLTIRCDVARYPIDPFVGRARRLIGSPPCQAWSLAGSGKGRAEVARVHAAIELCRDGWNGEPLSWGWIDERTPLILEPLRWIWALRDSLRWIACEQVPPALDVWRHMADVLRSWGFNADARILCAADFGVPQTRNRAFLLAHRERLRWPSPTHAERPEPTLFGPELLRWVSMADALGWRGELSRGNQQASRTGGRELVPPVPTDRPAPTVTGARSPWLLNPGRTATQPNRRLYGLDEPAPTIGFGHDANNWTWTLDRPATTIAGDPRVQPPGHKQNANDPPGRFNGRDGKNAIRVSVDDAAILQGFARPYPWKGTKSKQFEQVGNVVCPPVAAAIAAALEESTR